MKKNKARIQILNYVSQFMVSRFSEGYPINFEKNSLYGGLDSRGKIPVGSLVFLQAAPFSKWYISWLRQIDTLDDGSDHVYHLESIEDGEVCRWSNVSLWAVPAEIIYTHQEWQWEDEKFAFQEKWFELCKKSNAVLMAPLSPKFNGNEVTIGFRKYFENTVIWERSFVNYKKVSVKQMREVINDAELKRLELAIKP